MPKIKIDRVVSFSTEDVVHVAANILSNDPAKKWKCSKPGEKSCSIVLQLEKACVITSIDIGNEHAAYIEVLANRSSGDGDYKALLVMSAFMTPLESRQSQNINKVRMFSQEQLSKPECEQKWDQIKIVCTQPFNKHVQYGLSFVALQTNDDKTVTSNVTHIGKFTLRPESPDHLSTGTLFARRFEKKEYESNTPKKAAAAIRDASLNPCTPKIKTPIVKKPPSTKKVSNLDESETRQNRNRNEIMYTKEDEDTHDKIDKLIEKKKKEDEEKRLLEEKEKDSKNLKKDDTPKRNNSKAKDTPKRRDDGSSPMGNDSKDAGSSQGSSSRRTPSSKKRKSEDLTVSNKKAKINKPAKPFGQLMAGVTLVISGIQNPERGNIRTMALAMGARYKPDWDHTTTHLICAFPNTPKFNQVRGKGKIVTRKWISDSHSQRKRLPWRRYALDPNDQDQDESEEELQEEAEDRTEIPPIIESGSDTEDEIERIQQAQQGKTSDNEEEKNKKNPKQDRHSRITNQEVDLEDHIFNKPTDIVLNEDKEIKCKLTEQEIDLDDSIFNEAIDIVLQKDKLEKVETLDNKEKLLEEKPNNKGNKCKLPKLATFFEGTALYIDDGLDENIKKRLNRYIIAYKGQIFDDPYKADVVITEEDLVAELQQKYTTDMMYILPDWVWDCHNNKKIMPMDDFVL